ncbi:glycoside hydrolase family 76 protein [Chitinophaga sp. XS-30]|uniref:glycoside hydrolase family 76 protein n=1 Tax=Chitinophaga sp. XS-30 TaxID=2604421 RepID=UPI0011DD0C70|nr:glycoside hydrolase family 76 protein [Chitinophaga sp. XS-30]QEH42033.1 alpha-1,6-mannanase [Chitinophaga sp. XS-30]
MKKMFLLLVAFASLSCSKSDTGGGPSPEPPPLPVVSYTAKDANAAFNTFNAVFYSTKDKLYYSTTERKDIGSIWTQAVYWDLVMNTWKRTKDPAHLAMITDVYQGGYNRYDKFNWNNRTVWFIHDDMMWWIISLARAHRITGNEDYLASSIAGFQRVWDESYDAEGGGMWWDFNKTGKNSCINYPTVIAAMTLYDITGETAYLDKAKSIYSWGLANLYDPAKGRVADNNVNGNKGWSDYTYNQGTFIGAAVMLYKATGEQSYLDNAKQAADYTKNVMCDADGILPAEGDWNEQGVLKAIFGHYLMTLVNEGGQAQYLPWVRHNINTAWGNRDATRGITYRNYKVPCPGGVVQSYEASSAVMLMQVCPPAE